MSYQLHHGDCLAILPTLEDCSVDAIVTDPPAGIAFMGKAWDRDKGGKTEWIDWMFEVALQCRRVIKPGGHALVWAIPRTSHWTGTAWEDAGWQVRDKIYHVFGSGFPESMDVSKAIDKAAGAEREVLAEGKPVKRMIPGADQDASGSWIKDNGRQFVPTTTAPATPEAKQWAGWGTALKPAAEEWWLFRKPLEGTVAANVLKHGTGAINVDGCRVSHNDEINRVTGKGILGGSSEGWDRPWKSSDEGIARRQAAADLAVEKANALGRWPANFTHDGSDEVTELLCDAARFYYSPKASKADRDEGVAGVAGVAGVGALRDNGRESLPRMNHHPTVKPVDLMTYLCRLITPPGGTILDPFTGSGSTGKAAIIEDFKFIGIEREAEYIEIARARLDAAIKFRSGFLF